MTEITSTQLQIQLTPDYKRTQTDLNTAGLIGFDH